MSTTVERTEPSQNGSTPPTFGELQRRPTRKPVPWTRVGLAGAAAAVVLYMGGHWLFYDRFRVTTDDAYVDTEQVMAMSRISERVAAVLVDANQPVHRGQLLVVLEDATERARVALARQTLNSLQASAVAARRTADLEHEVQTAQVHSGGGAVDAARRSAELADSQAQAAQRAVSVARADVASAQTAVAVAEAAIPGDRRAVEQTQNDLHRTETLARNGYVSISALDAARTAASQAQSTLQAALASVATARANVREAQTKLVQAVAYANAAKAAISASRAQIPIAQGKLEESAAPSRVGDKQALASAAAANAAASAAQLRLAQLDLDATRIVSPVDGWVSSRDVEVGQTVSPGQALVTIAPSRRIFVTANYKETQMVRIHLGSPVEIRADACGGQLFHGTVIGVNPVAQSALSTLPALTAPTNFVKVPQRIPVRISLPPNAATCVFRPGMSVETSVLTK